MLKGSVVTLRPVFERDIDALYAAHIDLDSRGEYFPRSIVSRPVFARRALETGFWGQDDGMLIIASHDDHILGHIEFFKTVNYLDEY